MTARRFTIINYNHDECPYHTPCLSFSLTLKSVSLIRVTKIDLEFTLVFAIYDHTHTALQYNNTNFQSLTGIWLSAVESRYNRDNQNNTSYSVVNRVIRVQKFFIHVLKKKLEQIKMNLSQYSMYQKCRTINLQKNKSVYSNKHEGIFLRFFLNLHLQF